MLRLLYLLLFAYVPFLSGCSKKNAYPYYMEAPAILPKKGETVYPPMLNGASNGPLIVVDPGHGGKDLGTQSIKGPTYYEKNIALSTSVAVCQYLKMLGFTPVLTRERDEFIELKDRALFANRKKPIAFVSVHFNSAPSTQAEGIEVYYYNLGKDKTRVEKSKLLAGKILEGALAYTKAKSRGVKHGNFLVIRETDVPAVIVEGGFMTHDDEMQRIRDGSYLKKLAWGIAQGVKKYAGSAR
jgi:N-acetylmuramoyl-L-alanine amidase